MHKAFAQGARLAIHLVAARELRSGNRLTSQLRCHEDGTVKGGLEYDCTEHGAYDEHVRRHQHRASMESMGMARLLRLAAFRVCELLPSKSGTTSPNLSMAGSSPHIGSVSAESAMMGQLVVRYAGDAVKITIRPWRLTLPVTRQGQNVVILEHLA